MRFVAIDFETANHQADSACQLAAVVVRDAQIVEQRSWLIRPPRMYFSARNIAIHGIRPKDVQNAPTMEEVWGELQPLLDGEVLVAHNARFDLGVLVSSLSAFDVACPDLEFTCTRSLARGAWPGRPGYGLKPLGVWLGVDFKHHDALEDARCCALIALAVAKSCAECDLPGVENSLGIRRGTYRQGQLTSPRTIGRKRTASDIPTGRTATDRWGFPLKNAAAKIAVDPNTVVSAAAGQLPFAHRKFVFLGPLRGLSMGDTRRLAETLGATCQSTITAETDYVIACGSTLDDAKQIVCEALATTSMPASTDSTSTESNSRGIRLLSERQFLALLPGGKASTRA
jgi:DNA polymerase III subunit epsilon